MATGEFRPGSEIRVKALLGMFNYSYLWLREPGPMSPERIAHDFIDMVLSGLKVD